MNFSLIAGIQQLFLCLISLIKIWKITQINLGMKIGFLKKIKGTWMVYTVLFLKIEVLSEIFMQS